MPSASSHATRVDCYTAVTDWQEVLDYSVSGERTLRVPRYFFTIRETGRKGDDPHGTILPDDAAALSYAEHTILELQKEGGYDDPAMTMIVRNDADQMVWSIPFLPAYA
jgi:hypothetical protein